MDKKLADQAKALVAIAFRNGPLEDIHAGELCPKCEGGPQYSHITDDEMRRLMKFAVDRMYTLLYMREFNLEQYKSLVQLTNLIYTKRWDDPQLISFSEF